MQSGARSRVLGWKGEVGARVDVGTRNEVRTCGMDFVR